MRNYAHFLSSYLILKKIIHFCLLEIDATNKADLRRAEQMLVVINILFKFIHSLLKKSFDEKKNKPIFFNFASIIGDTLKSIQYFSSDSNSDPVPKN